MPLFIVFEGGEGSGKSTQARALTKRMHNTDRPVILTHEPGGTPIGNKLRHWIKWGNHLTPETELLFILAARRQLLAEIIRPALRDGVTIIVDRYYYSTIAYQGYGRGMDVHLLYTFNNFVTEGLQPDLVVFLDMEPKAGLIRKRCKKDRFEQEDVIFHERVREGYLDMARNDPDRWFVIDATLSRKEIEDLIWERVQKLSD